MAAAEAAGAASLPEEIIIWEILVHLPPKSLLRCRAVCRAWRHATSTRDFLLAHHDRQPMLPLLYDYDKYQDIVLFDHHRAAAEDQLQRILRCERFDDDIIDVQASCDGLLLLLYTVCDPSNFVICNPATRQYAPLRQLDDCGFMLLGMYLHRPTGEYRLLLLLPRDAQEHGDQETFHIFALGSCQTPRVIANGWTETETEFDTFAHVPVLFRGGLHWHLDPHGSGSNMIVVFDTTAESFRQMRSPVHGGHGLLFELDGMLAMYNFTDEALTVMDIWVLQDYESWAWAFKCRVRLPAEEIKEHSRDQPDWTTDWTVAATTSCDGDLFFLVNFGKCLHRVDIHGKLVDSFHGGLIPTQLRLKQTLVPHTFFPKIEGYVVNAPPFL